MTTQVSKQPAIFPDVPREPIGFYQDKDGEEKPIYLKEIWDLFFDILVLALQTNFSPEGIAVPQQSASNIGQLTGSQSIGSILYDSTNNQFKGNINGVWKTFTLT
jgi:hypothetical protein